MKKLFFLAIASSILLSSCVSQKKFADLQNDFDLATQRLTDANAKVLNCQVEKDKYANQLANLEAQNKFLSNNNENNIRQIESLTTLSQSASGNIKDIIAQLSEKDKYINGIRGAMSKKDSINLALAVNFKSVLADGIQDEDIMIDVGKNSGLYINF